MIIVTVVVCKTEPIMFDICKNLIKPIFNTCIKILLKFEESWLTKNMIPLVK